MIWVKWIKHEHVPDYWDIGWRFPEKNPTGDLGPVHGQYSAVMEIDWPHEGKPPEPPRWAE